MSGECIQRNYRLWIALSYFIAFCCQIPLLIEQMPAYIGVSTSFNTYTPAVAMIILGCLLFIIDRCMPQCGDKFRLQLFSAMLLSIGSAVWCICGVSWSSRLCAALFTESQIQRDQCWGSTFINFFAISCMILYLTISVIDDLFTPKARLLMILFVQIAAIIHLILYLVVNNVGPHQMTGHLKFYYYFLIIFVGTTMTISILSICTPHHSYTNNANILSFSLVFVVISSCIICCFLVAYGSTNYWFSQKINNGDGAAFIGYSIFYSTANVFIMIELYLYKKEMISKNGGNRGNYAYDAIDAQHINNEEPNVLI